jgi:hypothetical protein
MNRNQQIVVVVGLVLALLTALIPPWHAGGFAGDSPHPVIRRALLFTPPSSPSHPSECQRSMEAGCWRKS